VDGREVASVDRILYAHSRQVDPEALKALFGYYSGMGSETPWLTNPSRA